MSSLPIIDLFLIGLIRGSLYSLIAAGIALIFGVVNCSSFINGDLAMLGGYIGYFLIVLGLDPVIAMIIVGPCLFAVGFLIEKTTIVPLRRRGEYGRWMLNTLIVSLGTSMIFQNLALIYFGATYRGAQHIWPGIIDILGVRISLERIITFVVSVCAIGIFWFFLRKTKMGRAMRAVSADEEGAELMGINRDKMYSLAFAVSAMLSGLAGFLLIPIFALYPTVGNSSVLRGWVIMIMGGVGNIKGAIICSLILGLVESYSLYFIGGGWQNVVFFLVVMMVLIFKPSGLFGMEAKSIWEKPH